MRPATGLAAGRLTTATERRRGRAGRRGTSRGATRRRRARRDGASSTARRRATSSPRWSTRPISATFEASRSRWNIDSPANSRPMPEPVHPADEPAVAVTGLDGVRPAQAVQLDVGRADVRVDPAARTGRVGAGVDDLLERGVDGDVETPGRPAHRPRDLQRPGLQHAAAHRRPPQQPTGLRHREGTVPVGVHDRRRLEVGAGDDTVVVGPVRRVEVVPRRRQRRRPSDVHSHAPSVGA